MKRRSFIATCAAVLAGCVAWPVRVLGKGAVCAPEVTLYEAAATRHGRKVCANREFDEQHNEYWHIVWSWRTPDDVIGTSHVSGSYLFGKRGPPVAHFGRWVEGKVDCLLPDSHREATP